MSGKAYSVGVGPGDPELMTLKAVRMIRENDLFAVPGKDPRQSVAYKIAVQAVPELAEKEIISVYMPMVKNRELIDESAALGKAYCNLAKRLGVSFVDAGQWQIELAYDGVHFTPAGHRAFAKGLLKVLNKSA